MMERLDLFEERRKRAIPVAIYNTPDRTRAVILFSVGFGGSREGYAFLGRAWSQAGFRTLMVEHVGSNLQVLQSMHRPGQRHHQLAEEVGRRAREPEELMHRPQDLLFVWHRLVPEELPVGLGGHSFGAYTAAAALGAGVRVPESRGERKGGLPPSALLQRGEYPPHAPRATVRFKPPRPARGLLLMSPQPPGSPIVDYSPLTLPTLVMTGTRDSGMPAGVDYRERLTVVERLPQGRLELLEEADHMIFAGVGLSFPRFRSPLIEATLRFWEESLVAGA